ncbi:hypothetical protein M8523_24535 [Hyphomicrobiales bacterium BP6-180914]|uniref:Aldo/keto reductase n=2 Tax=Lichenifustis flavocetrariae TaxID=2949735 RepID=A0AA41YYZ8_9HYPH|nr:hypothetical protein [Lichenifustis flavocetrariae]MCW6511174.1 hypothetical protein [Lichenifustis flavocetrariae]
MPIPTLSVTWIIASPVITSVILGASRHAQLRDTLAAADLVLPSDLKARLNDITAEYRRGDAGR